ncbi:Salicylate carboxymethyltransferase [Handroanthus impetiginosus]|uniref:Salicylate carboxymethyltransferase n=1 Tax=Handroanthus impetiginosus TaxID=429701 RepID=A0A2G9HEC2_9LAMI|nr:Salicylate carboxymethyltransferase [Handroanthus impetiginosus]
MVVKNVTHMNAGNDEVSYANNSALQKFVISEALPVLDGTLKEMFSHAHNGYPKSLKIVDLGCSSGPNTFFIMSHILDTIEDLYQKKNLPHEFEVYLNDLPDNDFNNLFKLLPSLNGKEKKRQLFMYGLPGSFYGRLFPSKSLHFAYSSYSIHWLSQIPQGLENINKENIYMARTSPKEVFEAYSKQYQKDFSTFLSFRSKEMVSGGRMVLTIMARSVEDPSSKDDCGHLTLLSQTLLQMANEGLVKMDDLYSFNVPIYTPCQQEVETVIQNEGSFDLEKLHVFRVRWDAGYNVVDDVQEDKLFNKYKSGKLVANCVRAFMEPMLASHFGGSIIDELFVRYAEKVAENFSVEKSSFFNIVISLCRK